MEEIINLLHIAASKNIYINYTNEKISFISSNDDNNDLKQKLEQNKIIIENIYKENKGLPIAMPLSYEQRALWSIQQLHPNMASYNIVFPMKVNTEVDVDLLNRAMDNITQKYPILRVRFNELDGAPYQELQKNIKYTINSLNREVKTWKSRN